MSRGPQAFRQRDVTKAVRAVVAAGMTVTEIRVDKDGARIVVVPEPGKLAAREANEWDRI